MAEDDKYSEEELVLRDFLLDKDCLDPLADWTKKFNMFNILKITRTEIRHSNMLSWLLNPNENHGLNDSVLRGIIQYVLPSFSGVVDVFDRLLMDWHDIIIRREWRNIDIIAVSEKDKFVLCVENKIDSGEHSQQLARYQASVEETYPDYKKMYIFLSPQGSESSNPAHWCAMGYQNMLDIINTARSKVELLPEAKLLIDNYVETIRRDIVGDERLAQLCAEIYAKHQKALDLIFENKPDRASDVAEIFRQWAIEKTEAGELEMVLDKCNKTYTRFKTQGMSALLPDAQEAKSGWKTKNHYFYELINDGGNKFYIQLALSATNIPENLMAMCKHINVYYPSRQQKDNWVWRIPFSTRRSEVGEENVEEKIFELLNKKFAEIKAFEEKLNTQLNQE